MKKKIFSEITLFCVFKLTSFSMNLIKLTKFDGLYLKNTLSFAKQLKMYDS